MNLQQENYDVIEIFEENTNQLVVLAIENTHYEDVVIINKLTKSSLINADFLKIYKKVSSSILSIEETEEQVTIINRYKDTQLLSDYLIDHSLEFNERIRLAKSFLSQISNYESIVHPLQKVFIHTDQLTIRNDLLIFSDYIFLENYDESCTKEILHHEIGKILKMILQLHKESLSNEMASLTQLLNALEDGSDRFQDYNDVYNQFKVLVAKLSTSEDVIHYTEISTIVSDKHDHPTVDLEYIKNKKQIKLAQSSAEEGISFNGPNENNTFTETEKSSLELDSPSLIEYDQDEFDNLGLNPNFANEFVEVSNEPIFEGQNNVLDSEEETLFDETNVINDELFSQLIEVEEDNNITSEILSILDDLEKEKVVPEEVEEKDVLLDNILSDSLFESWLDKEDTVETINLVEDKEIEEPTESIEVIETITLDTEDSAELVTDKILDALIVDTEETQPHAEDENKSKFVLENDDLLTKEDINHADENILVDSPLLKLVEETSNTAQEEINADDEALASEEPFDDETEHVPHYIDDIEITTTLSLVQEQDVSESVENEPTTELPEASSQIEHINEILNRSNKEHSDLYITNEKNESKKTYYVPSFLAFFIVLLVITSLLLYYTSTYI